MRTFLTILVISSVVLSGCSRESRLRPSNWFNKNKTTRVAAPATEAKEVNPLIPEQTGIFTKRDKRKAYLGTPVAQITDVRVERATGGAIIRVTALTARQGAFDARLTSTTDGEPVNGVLSFALKAIQPTEVPQGSQTRRTLHVARFVSNDELEETSTIRIIGARNTLTSRP